MLSLKSEIQVWPIEGEFVISRGAKREAVVVVAEVSDGVATGRGECVPYARYGETPDSVIAQIEGLRGDLSVLDDHVRLQSALPAGAARNAVDCALWDLAAKASGQTAASLTGLSPVITPVSSAYTISLGPPSEMAARAKWAASFPLLKLKLGGAGDRERMRAVRDAVPQARLIVDANEAWTPTSLEGDLAAAKDCAVELVEQPLPAGSDAPLADIEHHVRICADEAHHTADDVPGLVGRYDVINVKLDKAGGLTEAIAVCQAAREAGLKVMVGCMVGTSLAMAPALLLAGGADWVDLDGPLLLANDRNPCLTYDGTSILPPPPGLWGMPVAPETG